MRLGRTVASMAGAVAALAIAATPAGAATPRWVLHVHRFPGGISAGVRAAVSPAVTRAEARHLRAVGNVVSAPPVAPPTLMNVQMNDDSNPPLPQNETSVAYSTRNPLIAVAASNDYVSGGVAVMRTTNGGRSWLTTRITPFFGGTGDTCSGGDPAVAYSQRDRAFYIGQLCFFRSQPFSEVQVYKSVDSGKTWTPGLEAAVAATNFDYASGTVDDSIF